MRERERERERDGKFTTLINTLPHLASPRMSCELDVINIIIIIVIISDIGIDYIIVIVIIVVVTGDAVSYVGRHLGRG